MELPDFWRAEVFHPLSVHFPIALLLTAAVFKLIALFSRRSFWSPSGLVLLALGTAGIWVAIYTGDLADGVVSRTICDPTVLKDHETAAYSTAWIFTAALVAELLTGIQLGFIRRLKKLIHIITFITMVVGSGFLIYVGHLGARLVYQQAAGVHRPSLDCAEFE